MKSYQEAVQNELYIDKNENYLISNQITKIVVKSGVTTSIIAYSNNGNLNFDIDVEKDACINLYNVIQKESDYQVVENIYLKENGSNASVISVVLGINNANIDSKISIYHNENNTVSQLKTYAIVKDSTNISLDNNAYIKKGSFGSIANQNAKGLSLSKNGTILVNPNLYIDEYDVMASHGVAMGSLNKDDLFYLMSRGLTKEEASQIVIMGFIEPMLSSIDNEEISNSIREGFQKN